MRPLSSIVLCGLLACGSEPDDPCPGDSCEPVDPCAATDGICPDAIQINELMPKNDGAWIDNALEADDWIELINRSDAPASLLGYTLSDSQETYHFLPATTLEPGETLLLWADDTPAQGPDHLDFKLTASGETLYLWAPDARIVDRISYPALAVNDSYARIPDGGDLVICRWSTPGRANGDVCGPPPPPELPAEISFEDFVWPEPWPPTPSPLVLNELALRPATFIEVVNTGSGVVDLSQYTVTVAAHAPGIPWPDSSSGVSLSWPGATVGPGERVVLDVTGADVAAIAATSDYEGVVTLWSAGTAVDRVDFLAWPSGAALARVPDTSGRLRFCSPTSGTANDGCVAVASRTHPDRLRHFYTPGDFPTLAEGGVAVGMQAVKWVVDMQAGDAVHLLSSARWDLHYTFVREIIDGDPHLDRCDPGDASAFYAGWVAFSQREYFDVDNRRYLLGTGVRHAGAGLATMEFATGDRIIGPQIERAFFDVAAVTLEPDAWSLRPQGAYQVEQMRTIEGDVPIVDPNAPFRGMTFQPLAEGVAYGILTFVSAVELDQVPLGRQVVVVTDQVPNDIPLVGGLITETFQTPLAHVNVLSRNRGTPNMALLSAHDDPRIAPFLGTLVRFEVMPGAFDVRTATTVEAEAFWESLEIGGEPLEPRLDLSERGVIPLAGRGLEDLPVVGAKAAGLAELARVNSTRSGCPGPVPLPAAPAAIAVVHSVEHLEACGAAALLTAAELDPQFRSDPQERARMLADIRTAILIHPVDATLVAAVETYITATFGEGRRVRLRSSSNTEDLPGFSGAGLYTSVSVEIGDPNRRVDDGIRQVWASLLNARAYDERRLFNVDESMVAMGILIHPSFRSEETNGIGISRNILEPIRSDQYYVNAQMGEASVANPAAGVTTEQLIYRWGRTPRLVIHAHSSLPNSVPVQSEVEIDQATCVLRAIHDHFRPLHDPLYEDRWFAMDIEFKRVHGTRALVVKQARPYSFGHAERPSDCREF